MTTVEDVTNTVDLKQIFDLLPHRYPFLLVDKVLDFNLDEGHIVAVKNVSNNEQFFQGHFPGLPLMPGVLILEALAQAGAIWYQKKTNDPNKISVLIGVSQAKFRRPVRPGDILKLEGKVIHSSTRGGRFHARATVDDQLACEAEISFGVVDREQL